MIEIQNKSTRAKATQKYATLTQLKFQRKYSKKEIQQDIRDLEMKFEEVDKIDDPLTWYNLQDQLGVAYQRLMNWWKNKNLINY